MPSRAMILLTAVDLPNNCGPQIRTGLGECTGLESNQRRQALNQSSYFQFLYGIYNKANHISLLLQPNRSIFGKVLALISKTS